MIHNQTRDCPTYWAELPKNQSCFDPKKLFIKLVRLTPRAIVGLAVGYYILGYAYAQGWMAQIDKIAIKVMLDYKMGYMAIGAAMPTVQYYASWGVRCLGGLGGAAAYDIVERVLIYAQNNLFEASRPEPTGIPV